MQQKESYDVLRLIEHGQICYISSENVQGRTLARYLKYHPVMEKKEMFLLLKAIAEQLELIHRCRGNPCYQYVNPYSVIVGEDRKVYLLDLASKEQEDICIAAINNAKNALKAKSTGKNCKSSVSCGGSLSVLGIAALISAINKKRKK